jgi:hypothetical protein
MCSFESQRSKSDVSSEKQSAGTIDMTQIHASIQPKLPAGGLVTEGADESLLITPISTVIGNHQVTDDSASTRHSKSRRTGGSDGTTDPLLETTSAWGQHAYLKAKQLLSPEQFGEFKTIMNKFESKHENPAEVDGTYRQISRLLDATSGAIPEAERIDVAVQILSHAAQPNDVGQGQHELCAVAGLETREYSRSPSKAAEVVATAALTGQWTAPDGKPIKLDPRGLVPGSEEAGFLNGIGRDEASQLFQLAITNDITQRLEEPIFYNGTAGDEVTSANGQPAAYEGGNQLIGLPPDLVAQAGQRDFGDSNFFLMSGVMVESGNLPTNGLTEFPSSSALKAILSQSENYPMLMGVDGRKLFGADGLHVIRILSEDPKSGNVTVSDPNFPSRTSEFSFQELYQASM